MSDGKPTEFGLWPTNITSSELTTALLNGLFGNKRAALVGGYPRWGFVSLS
jgi:hypothetical protein